MNARFADLIGRRFEKLTVLALAGSSGGRRRWMCACDCGNKKMASTSGLVQGETKSCGCDRRYDTRTTHGMKGTPTYSSWSAMMTRCFNEKDRAYASYGGSGITVCERWRNFESFLADIGERPGSEYSLDRIDGAKGYEPGNVRWATAHQQIRNRRVNRLTDETAAQIRDLHASGVRQCDLAKQFGISQSLVCYVVGGKIWRPLDEQGKERGGQP